MRRYFTLIETMITVVIVLVIASLGIVSYRQLLDSARQKVCELNLKTLEKATEFYALEEDGLPASLGKLKREHIERAYAWIMKREGNLWINKLAFLFVKLNTPPQVYAQFLTPDNLRKYGVTKGIFHCPSDPSGNISYGINVHLAGKKWEDILWGTPIIAETCGGNLTFDPDDSTTVCARHIRNFGLQHITQAVLKGKILVKGKPDTVKTRFGQIATACIEPWRNYCVNRCGSSQEAARRKCIRNCIKDNLGSLISCVKSIVEGSGDISDYPSE